MIEYMPKRVADRTAFKKQNLHKKNLNRKYESKSSHDPLDSKKAKKFKIFNYKTFKIRLLMSLKYRSLIKIDTKIYDDFIKIPINT
ncbi:hypothetical protein BpHYR1_051203 [Brachionus plicatilis]|uniref:Uncharacterized protein n=1 Tax=Brachionus plicatilis TaxID=10195 RepID=A0A3M7S4C8_BRAPC|nr:hypothetical protein BpHYR1_051203 [Brachionus plicatilis]